MAAAAWIDGWRIVSIDDLAAIDVGIRETVALPPPPEVLGGRGGLLRAWSIDTSWLHPPADAALVVTASSAVDSVLEFAVVAPDAGVRFQYAWNAGFDGALPVPPEIDVDGWVPG